MSGVKVDDFEAWANFRRTLERMPEEVARIADGIIADEAKAAAAEMRQEYRDVMVAPEETGNLVNGVQVLQVGPLHWKVRSVAPHAHLWEYGTDPRRAPSGANRGRMFGAQGDAPQLGGRPARPVLVPVGMRRRRQMVKRLVALMERQGFTVTGDA